jgi:hypothetical protein
MESSITVRLDEGQRKALADAARRQGKSVSDIVRDALDRSLAERPVSERAGHVTGQLRLSRSRRAGWRDAIRDRNWRA